MTTTLRPAAPEEHGPDGARSRHFTVCVNSRPVGAIHLATDARFGPEAGRIVSLRIEERDRGRGRATVAALAAEEVLRDWGCRRVEATVPQDTAIALRLATALGYTERNRAMLKELPGTPAPLPEGSAVRPMGEAEYAAWHSRERAGYIRAWTSRGVPHDQAAAAADEGYRKALPDGVHTADTALRTLVHDGADVGWLWLRLRTPGDASAPGWVFAVEVAEARRGEGHGRTLMLAAERECLAAGVHALGLNVFTANTPALRLYESLGYRTTARVMVKPLL